MILARVAVPGPQAPDPRGRYPGAVRRASPAPVAGRLGGAPGRAGAAPSYAPDRVIVRFAPGAGRARRNARDAVDATSTHRLDIARTELVRLPAGRSVPAALRRLRARDDVEFAQPDLSYALEGIPNDSLFPIYQWGLNNTGQIRSSASPGTPDADIDAP